MCIWSLEAPLTELVKDLGSCSWESHAISQEARNCGTFFLCPLGDKTKQRAVCIILCIVGKFNWKGTIKAVLKQAPDNEISVKKLKKKVHPATNKAWNSWGEVVLKCTCVLFNLKTLRQIVTPTSRAAHLCAIHPATKPG